MESPRETGLPAGHRFMTYISMIHVRVTTRLRCRLVIYLSPPPRQPRYQRRTETRFENPRSFSKNVEDYTVFPRVVQL